MGLLTDGDAEENLETLKRIISEVLVDWENNLLVEEGISVQVSNRALSRICLLAEELFDGRTFPEPPGPFKRAAAVCTLVRMFGQFTWVPEAGRAPLSELEEQAWVARFALATVPVTLYQMEVILDDEAVILGKAWEPATLHLQVELLNWLRWLEPPQLSTDQVDLGRIQKTVMALAMAIEESYYLVDTEPNCDVMHRAGDCLVATLEDDTYRQDLSLFYPVTSQ
jgi:hypothetical protein